MVEIYVKWAALGAEIKCIAAHRPDSTYRFYRFGRARPDTRSPGDRLMTHNQKVLGFALVALLGIYGCAKGPPGSPTSATDNKTNPAMEARVLKLEEALRSTAA